MLLLLRVISVVVGGGGAGLGAAKGRRRPLLLLFAAGLHIERVVAHARARLVRTLAPVGGRGRRRLARLAQ